MAQDTLLGFPAHTLPFRCEEFTTLSTASNYIMLFIKRKDDKTGSQVSALHVSRFRDIRNKWPGCSAEWKRCALSYTGASPS